MDNLNVIYEAINVEKQTITGTLQNVKHKIADGSNIATISEHSGICTLDRKMVKSMPAFHSERVLASYFDSITSLNKKFSNCELPDGFSDMQGVLHTLSDDTSHHFVSSMGMVPNKRMTDQGNFNHKCEFGSLTHKVAYVDTSARCILGKQISYPEITIVADKYSGHLFYQRYIREALINLKLQSDETADQSNDMDTESNVPNYMKHPIVEDSQSHTPIVLHTAHAVITIYKTSKRIMHEFDTPENYNLPTMSAVYRSVADINLTTVTFSPFVVNQSTGYLKRAFNADHREFVVSQNVNYKCTYHDRQKAHLPDVEFKIITVNNGNKKPGLVGAIVHEFGNGPAAQFNITSVPGSSFFGFGMQIASEVIHQSTIDALHDIVKRKDNQKFDNVFSGWNVGDQLPILLFNLIKNITPYNRKTDDPDLIFGKQMDASSSNRFDLLCVRSYYLN